MKKLSVLALLAVAGSSFGQLWNNGPVSTGTVHAGTGTTAPGGGTWSELQLTNNVLGFATQTGANIRVADDFTVGPGGWNVTSFDFLAYLTGATTPSTTSGVLEIWNGRPGDVGSTVIFGDTTTNRYAGGSTMSNIYRTGAAAAGTTRQLQNIRLNTVVTLAAGTYWAEWGFVGPTFAPPVTIVGSLNKPGSNGRQWNVTAWVDLTDTGTSGTATTLQDMPFVINGSPVPEPASIAVLGLGALALIRRRRSKKA